MVHQVTTPGVNEELGEQADVIAGAVEQVAGYYRTIDEDNDREPLSVVLTGPGSGHRPFANAISSLLQRELLTFAPPLVYPDHFPHDEYATNLALALADRTRAGTPGKVQKKSSLSINLLPERHAPRTLSARPFAVAIGLLLLAAAAFFGTGQVGEADLKVETLSVRLEALERQERLHTLSLAGAQVIEQRIQKAAQVTNGLESHLKDLDSSIESLLQMLETITQGALPPGVRLTSFTPQGDDIILFGSASTYKDVVLYATNLQQSGHFSDVSVVRAEGPGVKASSGPQEDTGSGNVNFQLRAYVPSGTEASGETKGQ